MREVLDWNGRPLILSESAGGVLAFQDPLRGLLQGEVLTWPAPDIVQKLYKSKQQKAYKDRNLKALTSTLGYYSDLQSVHSEDAITWNVFGPIAYATEKIRLEYCRSLFRIIDPSLPDPSAATISLWRRVPHPDTSVSGGPEIDVLIQTPETVVVGEAKWMSRIGSGQGKNKNKDQITLRKEFLEGLGRRIYGKITICVVLSIVIERVCPIESNRTEEASTVLFREVTWEDVCSARPHPVGDELLAYLDWKKRHSKRLMW